MAKCCKVQVQDAALFPQFGFEFGKSNIKIRDTVFFLDYIL